MTKRDIISKNILTLRKKNKMTQADLAEKLNYSDKAISKWERGESLPDAEMLYNIAELFNVEIGYLFEEHLDDRAKEEKDKEEKELARRELKTKLIFAIALASSIFSILGVVAIGIFLSIGIPSYMVVIMYILSAIPSMLLIIEIFTGIRPLFNVVLSVTLWSWANSLHAIFSINSGGTRGFVWIYAIAVVLQTAIIVYPRLLRGVRNPKKKRIDKSENDKTIKEN